MVGKQEGPPLIEAVIAGRPAAEAGVKPETISWRWMVFKRPVTTMLSELVDGQARSHQGKPLSVSLLRGTEIVNLKVAAQLDSEHGKYLMGVRVQPGVVGYSTVVKYASVGTPAEKVGFVPGDKIISVAGKKLKHGFDFNRLFARSKEDPVLIEIDRGGAKMMLPAPKKNPLPDDLYDAETMGLIGLVFDLEGGAEPAAAKAQYKRLGITSAFMHSYYDNLEQGLGMVYGIYLVGSGKLGFQREYGWPNYDYAYGPPENSLGSI